MFLRPTSRVTTEPAWKRRCAGSAGKWKLVTTSAFWFTSESSSVVESSGSPADEEDDESDEEESSDSSLSLARTTETIGKEAESAGTKGKSIANTTITPKT